MTKFLIPLLSLPALILGQPQAAKADVFVGETKAPVVAPVPVAPVPVANVNVAHNYYNGGWGPSGGVVCGPNGCAGRVTIGVGTYRPYRPYYRPGAYYRPYARPYVRPYYRPVGANCVYKPNKNKTVCKGGQYYRY